MIDGYDEGKVIIKCFLCTFRPVAPHNRSSPLKVASILTFTKLQYLAHIALYIVMSHYSIDSAVAPFFNFKRPFPRGCFWCLF